MIWMIQQQERELCIVFKGFLLVWEQGEEQFLRRQRRRDQEINFIQIKKLGIIFFFFEENKFVNLNWLKIKYVAKRKMREG